MMVLIRTMVGFLSMWIAVSSYAQSAEAESTAGADLDPEAMEVLKAMSDYLGAAEVFAYQAETSYDAVQDSGAKLEFGASRKILVARPNRMRMESVRRDGLHAMVVFTGKTIGVYTPDQNAYASVDQPGDLDESIDFAVARLRMKAPLADLVSSNLYDDVEKDLSAAWYLDETVVAGVACDHLLFRNDYADFQMWVTQGSEPVLRRIVITYREEQGEPQYRAQFLKWNVSPDNVEKRLQFSPPEDAERIRFYVDAESSDSGQEGS